MTQSTTPTPPLAAEWLEADRSGGYASGTVGGERTRRYHALLLTAATPPTTRMVLVNGLEAWLDLPDGSSQPLTTQRYLPDVLHPEGFRTLTSFTATPWPAWTYATTAGPLTQELLVEPDAGDTVLRWTGPAGATLSVRPLLSGRAQDALHRRNPGFDFTPHIAGASNVSWRPYNTVPAVAACSSGAYIHGPQWYENFLYTVERSRGLDCVEDLASPGTFRFPLGNAPAILVLRAGDSLNTNAAAYANMLFNTERLRRARSPLRIAAGSYIVRRATQTYPAGRTIMAGFPWFADWGRDSFISMRGLMLATGRLKDARALLVGWASEVSQGMLPNRFPEDGSPPEFNTVDASLWYAIAAHDYLAAAPADHEAETILATAIQSILRGYQAGTRFSIRMDTDALIAAGEPGVQLTWMDAKVDNWVVTPRIGKPVEIQALWYNALRIAARWNPAWATLADQALASFHARFPAPHGGLFDVIDVDHVPGRTDAAIRPNQLYAIGGLPYPLLEGAPAAAILAQAETHLLTPLGMRTLSPTDPAYQPRYQGDRYARDGAYHQGTVWPFLLGPFVEAWLRVNGNTPAARAEATTRFLAPLDAHRTQNGLGHITEVADGEAPHTPGGCPFQAWSMGEYLRLRALLGPPSGIEDDHPA